MGALPTRIAITSPGSGTSGSWPTKIQWRPKISSMSAWNTASPV